MHSTENGTDTGGDQQRNVTTGAAAAAEAAAGATTSPTATATTGVASAIASSITASLNGGGAARECAGCGKRITERFLLKALDLFWHEDCLKCGCCDCRLGEVGSTLYTKANLILCKRDYLRLFGTTGYCAACNKVIPAFEMVMRAKSNVYHLECFACQQCNHRFCVGDRFYLCDNKILCEYDYEERLVFANMAYNPSSLAHIRRQVNNLQPALCSDNHTLITPPPTTTTTTFLTQQRVPMAGGYYHQSASCCSEKSSIHQHHLQQQQQQQQVGQRRGEQRIGAPPPPLSSGGTRGDDGSSGYGSPDSETLLEATTTSSHTQ